MTISCCCVAQPPTKTARAYHLLKKLDLGPTLKRSTEQPHLVFRKGDLANEDSRWVDARDHLTLLVAGALNRSEASRQHRTGHMMP
jgi:hypothetical protein